MDTERIKSLLRGHWRQALVEVGGFPPNVLDGKHHPCIFCGGKDRFEFSDKDGDGSIICRNCGKGIGDGIAAIRWKTG